MNVHKNARLTPRGRERIVNLAASGQTPKAIGQAAGVCPRTVRKWLKRHDSEGFAGLQDRSSRPHRLRRLTPQPVIERIAALRRQRLTGKAIAAEVGVSHATVSRILRRLGLNKLSGHLGIGWEFVHVCIDDASRLAFSRVMEDERKQSAVAFLKAAVAYYVSLGVKIERVMTDNGSCYRSKAFARACRRFGLKHIFTRPYTPKTNGKAERFIQTSLREWAYAHPYNTSDERTAELSRWLHRYNWHRPHGSLGSMPPISRLGLTGNNLLRLHI